MVSKEHQIFEFGNNGYSIYLGTTVSANLIRVTLAMYMYHLSCNTKLPTQQPGKGNFSSCNMHLAESCKQQLQHDYSTISLVPSPRPPFRHLQYEKAGVGRAWEQGYSVIISPHDDGNFMLTLHWKIFSPCI